VKANALIFATLLASGSVFACEKPPIPELPDPNTAVTAQMVKAKNEIKAFIASAEAYLACVEDGDTSAYNSMVEEMQAAADSFNTIVRKYKTRMAG
jgi:hypothetical protein